MGQSTDRGPDFRGLDGAGELEAEIIAPQPSAEIFDRGTNLRIGRTEPREPLRVRQRGSQVAVVAHDQRQCQEYVPVRWMLPMRALQQRHCFFECTGRIERDRRAILRFRGVESIATNVQPPEIKMWLGPVGVDWLRRDQFLIGDHKSGPLLRHHRLRVQPGQGRRRLNPKSTGRGSLRGDMAA